MIRVLLDSSRMAHAGDHVHVILGDRSIRVDHEGIVVDLVGDAGEVCSTTRVPFEGPPPEACGPLHDLLGLTGAPREVVDTRAAEVIDRLTRLVAQAVCPEPERKEP